ncbi:MAG TPA: class I SAM-dependent methyltransferase [Acidimicrobiales bacterium]|nr:class I SAM-dependent methyltransferase [Acidimicrobiales bacterium]
MKVFEEGAADYDAGRPSYPVAVYDLLDDLLGGLCDKLVLDAGAGTGVVTRQLLDRGAVVIALDTAVGMLARARRRTPLLPAVIGDAAAALFQPGSLDLACFGQSWHWVDQQLGAAEIGSVLRPGGWWAAWWSHPWADGEAWFEDYWTLIEDRCPETSRHQREIDWCAEGVARDGNFNTPERKVISWERRVEIDHWLADLRSHSYVLVMDGGDRERMLQDVAGILRAGFPEGRMAVAYQTRVWVAARR